MRRETNGSRFRKTRNLEIGLNLVSGSIAVSRTSRTGNGAPLDAGHGLPSARASCGKVWKRRELPSGLATDGVS
jgi:hypothetical protein